MLHCTRVMLITYFSFYNSIAAMYVKVQHFAHLEVSAMRRFAQVFLDENSDKPNNLDKTPLSSLIYLDTVGLYNEIVTIVSLYGFSPKIDTTWNHHSKVYNQFATIVSGMNTNNNDKKLWEKVKDSLVFKYGDEKLVVKQKYELVHGEVRNLTKGSDRNILRSQLSLLITCASAKYMESVYNRDNMPNPHDTIDEYTPPSITAFIYKGTGSGSIKRRDKAIHWLDKNHKGMMVGFVHITDRNREFFKFSDIARIVFGVNFRKSLNEKDVNCERDGINYVRKKAYPTPRLDSDDMDSWKLDVVGRVAEKEDNEGDTNEHTAKKSKLQRAIDIGADAMNVWNKFMAMNSDHLSDTVKENWDETWDALTAPNGPIHNSSKGSEKKKASAKKRSRESKGIENDSSDDEDSFIGFNYPTTANVMMKQFTASVGKTKCEMRTLKQYNASEVQEIIDNYFSYVQYYEEDCDEDNLVMKMTPEFIKACVVIFRDGKMPTDESMDERMREFYENLIDVSHSWELIPTEGTDLHFKRTTQGKTWLHMYDRHLSVNIALIDSLLFGNCSRKEIG